MSAKRTIVMHIGLPKTGSSALQSFFATNAQIFRRYGVVYPNHPNEAAARNERVTSGNAPGLYLKAQQGRADEFLDATTQHAEQDDTLLLSSEFLGKLERADIEHLVNAVPPTWHLKVICFVRNVYPLLWSTYGQNVKGGGLTAPFAKRIRQLKQPYSHHITLREWRSFLAPEQLRVLHYESHADSLMECITREINVPLSACTPITSRVNRGLTPSEVEVLRKLNISHRGWLSKDLSNALLQRSTSGSFLPFYREAVSYITTRYKDVVREINDQFFDGMPTVSLGLPPQENEVSISQQTEAELYKTIAQVASKVGARKALKLQLFEARELLETNPRRAQKLLLQILRRDPECKQAQQFLSEIRAG